jgi:hypothetical protein
MRTRNLTAVVVAGIFGLATQVFAKPADTARATAAAPTPNASENYPVTYPGGAPPAPVSGALDTDDSTYNRVLSGACASLSAVGTAVYYDTITVTYTGSGTASLTMTTTGGDTFLTAYSPSFNPAAPSANCVAANDDTAGVPGNGSRVSGVTFAPGQTIIFVVSSFDNAATFSWTADFTGTLPVRLQEFLVE